MKGIKQFVLESIVGSGGKPCPPDVGVGIGGSADYAMYLAVKEAITRPIGTRNADPDRGRARGFAGWASPNETGIGPMGLGGDASLVPNCHIEHADTT